jgi:hypothetical protein
MYFAPMPGWRTESMLEVLNYPYINGSDFDVLLIMQQRVTDYLASSAEGIDPERFAQGTGILSRCAQSDGGGLRVGLPGSLWTGVCAGVIYFLGFMGKKRAESR